MHETHFESEYQEKILDYALWIEKADQLLEVASFLKPEIEKTWGEMTKGGLIKEHYITTYFMLTSYALENLLKALYVKTNCREVKAALEKSCQLPRCISTHNLWQLAKRFGVVRGESGEESLLKKLSRSAEWFGRYPVPTSPRGLKRCHNSESESENIPIPFCSYMNTDLEEIEEIISSIRSRLNQNNPL